jgi:hypothetical protein
MIEILHRADEAETKQPEEDSSQDLSAFDFRRERRYLCNVTPVAVQPPDDPEPFAARIINVSKSGLRLLAARSLWPGQRVAISFADAKRNKAIRAEARFCQSPEDGIYEIGLEITNFIPATKGN